jgi:hypothetical protein
MAEATAKYKEQDAQIMEQHSKKFGINIKETFSSEYEGESPEPATTTKETKDGGINDLMD